MAWDTDSYNTVPERLAEFRAKFPEGSLQSSVILWPTADIPFIAVEARAYRTPDDPTPGVGLAYEPWPGKTSFTRDSELQNAETSAWGRALIAIGAADAKKGVASAEEIRNRRTSVVAADSLSATAGTTSPARPNVEVGVAHGPAGGTPLGGGEHGGDGEAPPSDSPSDDIRAAMSNYLSLCEEAGLKPLQTFGKALKRAVKTDDLLHASLPDLELAIAYVAQTLVRARA